MAEIETCASVILPEKARWTTQYTDGSERTTIEVNVRGGALKVVIDPDSDQWCSISPDDLVWLAGRLLDANAMLAARKDHTDG